MSSSNLYDVLRPALIFPFAIVEGCKSLFTLSSISCAKFSPPPLPLVNNDWPLRKLKVSSLDLYLDKHSISCSRSTLKNDKVGIAAAHIARSIVNNDAKNNEEDDVEDEESEEEYRDDVVLEEIGDDSDEDETTDTAQQSEKEDDSEGDDGRNDNDNSDCDDDDDGDDGDDDDDDNDDSGGCVSDDINEGSDEEVQITDILCTTKSGRTCRTWKGRYLYY